MKILFLDAYHNPERIAFTHLEDDLIDGIIKSGHEIDVICPVPTRGIDSKIVSKYKRIKYEEKYNGKLRIHRFWAPQERRNPVLRAFRYIWCNCLTYLNGRKYKYSNIDVIFANSTPPTQGLIASMLKKKLRCKFVYSLQDIFPDSLVTTGLVSSKSIFYKIGNIIANRTYRNADYIIVISKSFKNNILKKGVPESKIHLIYNWVDTEKVKPVKKENNRLFDELQLNRHVPMVVYAGNFGASQNGQIIIEVAKYLKNDNIQFVLFGAGSEYMTIRKSSEDLPNVHCYDLLPIDRVSEVYSLGDVVLITNAPGVGDCGMPSKLWSIMATNTPIVASVDEQSELATVIRNHAYGKVVAAGQISEFADAIVEAIHNKQKKLLVSPREYTEKWAGRENAVKQYLKLL